MKLQDKKYDEFRVVLNGGKIVKKELTDRGHVMITDRDAEINNANVKFTKLFYELAEVPKSEKEDKKPGRTVKKEK